MTFPTLVPYGWDDHWAALLADVPGDVRPARIVRHDGTSLLVAAPEGVVVATLARRLDPEPAVGDWVALEDDRPVAVLERSSLLRRRAANSDTEQALAANVDVVLLVCGADRPMKIGRIQRGATLARDAGCVPVIVLTKAELADDIDGLVAKVEAADLGLDLVVTSVEEGEGVPELAALVRGRTVTLLGESGAGKSSIVNAILGREAATTGRVRVGDAKGRHTTTARQLHVLAGGGTVIDTPGIRSVGLWVDPDAVSETFADIDELGDGCRFVDCEHQTEPGCVITAAVAEGTLTAERLAAWRALREEAEALAEREQRQRERRAGRDSKGGARRRR